MEYFVYDIFNQDPPIPAELDRQCRIVVLSLWEPSVPNSHFLDQLLSRGNPITLFLNTWARGADLDPRIDVIYMDFCLWRSYNEIVVKKTNAVNVYKWPSENKFLFLTGKPDKVHRIGFLYELEKHGLTDQCVHSLFVNEYNKAKCQDILKVDDQEFQRFVSKFQNNPDAVLIKPADSIHYGGIPYDPKLYSLKFRVISETNTWLTPAFPTEKTYITILNQQPFLILGDYKICDTLNHCGFQTFDQYLCMPYDNLANYQRRQNAVIANVRHWLDRDFDMTTEVLHNYNQLVKIAKQTELEVNQQLASQGLCATINDIVKTHDPQQVTAL